jgi:hypothetical protein
LTQTGRENEQMLTPVARDEWQSEKK